MKAVTLITAVLIVAALTSCGVYQMQTPVTVPAGKWAVGVGGGVMVRETIIPALPGVWLRRGLSPRMDLGFHLYGLPGLGVDLKYRLNKYLSAGLGGGLGMYTTYAAGDWSFDAAYGVAGAVYAGIPGDKFTPYASARMGWGGALGAETLDASGVVGFSVPLSRRLSLYLQGGAGSSLLAQTPNIYGLATLGLAWGY